MALTELALRNLKPKIKLYRIADSGGLAISVSPSGSKLWRLRYYYQGKAQMMALGKYPAVGLADARRKRDEAKALIAERKDPVREKQKSKLRAEIEGGNTFERVTRQWFETKQKGLNEKYVKQNLARMERQIFPKIGGLPIGEITIPDVVRVIESISNKGTVETAKRMKQIISQVFRFAAQRGLCIHNPAADLRDILPTVDKKHHACIHPSELPALLQAIHARENDLTKYAMLLLSLTFVRTGELIGAKWDEMDWERKEWRIPKDRMKMKRPHVVPLSRQAVAILMDLQKRTGDKTHLFHSAASESKHISNGTVLMGLRRMGYSNSMTGHGFRTLASTILNEKGYAPDVIERQLAHEDDDKIRSAYNRAEYLPERIKMMQDYADYLEMIAEEADEKVISVKKVRVK